MKKALDYFEHDSDASNHPKMLSLRAWGRDNGGGFAAVGRFWTLNEMIASSDGARLDLSLPRNRAALATRLDMSNDDLDGFLGFLADDDRCGLIVMRDMVVTTERVTGCMERVQEHRDKQRTKKESERSRKVSETFGQACGKVSEIKQQSRVEKSRVENTQEAHVPISETVGLPPAVATLPVGMDGTSRIDRFMRKWNELKAGKNEHRSVILLNSELRSRCLAAIKPFTDEQILDAIKTYADIRSDPGCHLGFSYGGFYNFLAGPPGGDTGVAYFVDREQAISDARARGTKTPPGALDYRPDAEGVEDIRRRQAEAEEARAIKTEDAEAAVETGHGALPDALRAAL